jgi:cytochrome P450
VTIAERQPFFPEPEGGAQPELAMPPRPSRPLPVWQLLRTFASNSLAACDAELFEELIVERRLAWRRVFVVSDPEGLRRILQTNMDNYVRITPVRRAFTFSSGGGMNHLEGEAWWRHRRIINPALDNRALQPDVAKLIELTEEMARHLAALPAGQEIEIGRALTHLITRTTGHVFTGEGRQIDALLLRLGRFPENYGPLDALPLPRWLYFIDRYRRRWTGIEEFFGPLDRLFTERRREDYSGTKDLLWRLANARDQQTGQPLSLAELRDEVLTLAAGAQAPLRALTWGFYLLAKFPAAEQQLHAELDAELGGRSPTPADVGRLSYLRRFVDETMRLYPPLPVILRVAVADDTVCGRRIPRGSFIAIMPWVIHRHRKLWRDPDRFDPERFAADRPGARPSYGYVPFGVGPRVCVAASLGMIEILTGMAVLAQRLRFRLVPGQTIEPTAWSTLRPKNGILMTVEPR